MANPVRVKTSAGWQDLALVGPQGPAGPQGPPGSGGITEAPNDGQQYARKNLGWTVVISSGGTAASTTFTPAGNIAATNVQAAIAEVDAEKVAKAGDTMTGALALPAGTQALPALNFGGDAAAGFYRTAANGVGVSTNNFSAMSWAASGKTTFGAQALGYAGSATLPTYAFASTLSSGMYISATNTLGFSSSGALRLSISPTLITSTLPVVLPADPTTALQAATKQYVDSKAGGAVAASAVSFVPVGYISATNVQNAVEDHEYRKVDNNNANIYSDLYINHNNPRVVLSRGAAAQTASIETWDEVSAPVWSLRFSDAASMDVSLAKFDFSGEVVDTPLRISNATGLVTVSHDPTAALGVATKQYVDSKAGGAGRVLVAANLSFFVRTDGNDANDGLADTAGGAFRTVQKAWDNLAKYDLNGFAVMVNVGAGTYTGTGPVLSTTRLKYPIGGGDVTFYCNNAVFTSTSGVISHFAPVHVTLAYVTLNVTSIGHNILCSGPGAWLEIGSGVVFGPAGSFNSYHMSANDNARISGAVYSVTGNATVHLYLRSGAIASFTSGTVTLTGTLTFTTWLDAAEGSRADCYSQAFTGTATAKKYSVTTNAIVNGAGNVSKFPGATAGTTATGGQYY